VVHRQRLGEHLEAVFALVSDGGLAGLGFIPADSVPDKHNFAPAFSGNRPVLASLFVETALLAAGALHHLGQVAKALSPIRINFKVLAEDSIESMGHTIK
jgi:hypothetical protein